MFVTCNLFDLFILVQKTKQNQNMTLKSLDIKCILYTCVKRIFFIKHTDLKQLDKCILIIIVRTYSNKLCYKPLSPES